MFCVFFSLAYPCFPFSFAPHSHFFPSLQLFRAAGVKESELRDNETAAYLVREVVARLQRRKAELAERGEEPASAARDHGARRGDGDGDGHADLRSPLA